MPFPAICDVILVSSVWGFCSSDISYIHRKRNNKATNSSTQNQKVVVGHNLVNTFFTSRSVISVRSEGEREKRRKMEMETGPLGSITTINKKNI